MQEYGLDRTTDWDSHNGNNNELVIVISVTLGCETQDWGYEGDWIQLNVGERSVEIMEIVTL